MAQTDTSVLEWPSLVDEEVVHVEGDPQLRVVFWTRAGEAVPSGEARAVAIYHPGMGEHSGRYRHIASELLSRCPSLHAFATHDMRGHGGSSGARGAIESTTELEDDFVKRVLPAVATRFGTELRVLLMGHSLGGLVTARVANSTDVVRASGHGEIVGVFLSAPAVEPVVQGVVNRALVPLLHVIAAFPFMRRVTKANAIRGEVLTHDRKVIDMYNQGDAQMTDQLSFGLASSILTSGPGLVRDAQDRNGSSSVLCSNVPVLIVHGEMDNLTKPSGSERLAQAIGHEVELKVIPRALHEVHCELSEYGRTAYFDRLVAFVNDAINKTGSIVDPIG